MKDHRFTSRGIAALPLPKSNNQILYPDLEQQFLYVRVTTGGARSFVVDKNTKRGRIRITLGPAGTDTLTATQAREQAQITLGLIAEGYTAQQIRDRLDRTQDRIPSGATSSRSAPGATTPSWSIPTWPIGRTARWKSLTRPLSSPSSPRSVRHPAPITRSGWCA